MESGEPITYKAALRAVVAGAILYFGTMASVVGWVDYTKLDAADYQGTKDDIKWIKECMIKKCWDQP